VQLLGSKGENSGGFGGGENNYSSQPATATAGSANEITEAMDDLPF
jgi:hypothetical protein